jgi:cell wall-associated NlpC family hydrolase
MPTETEQRDAIVAEARSWIRTPHHNGARIKGVGVDCGQFPLAVYEAAGMLPKVETDRYSPQFHLNRDKEWYLQFCQELGLELPPGEKPKRGDFAIYRIGFIYSHGAIIVKWPHIIHALYGVGVITDNAETGAFTFNKDRTKRDVKFFTAKKWG